MSSWRDFFNEHGSTLGVTLVFAALGSGISLWAADLSNPVTKTRALFVLATGQLVNFCVTVYCLGVLQWSQFVAPGVGAICGIIGISVISVIIKRAPQIADTGVDIALRKKGDA